MKRVLLCALIIVIFAIMEPLAYPETLENVPADNATIKQYGLFEISIPLTISFQNPYDYSDIDLAARITCPDGKTVSVPAFYSGKGALWKIRYRPTMSGRFSYILSLKSSSSAYSSETKYFDVTPSPGNGFLRRSSRNPFYPVFDSGKPFIGLGHDIGWTTSNSVTAFEKYFIKFKESGCNLTRIWLNCPWTLSVESKGSCLNYDKVDLDKIDSLLELAAKYDIYIIMVLDSYASLMDEPGPWGEQFWKRNPYNKLNGGPCDKPWDFFTDDTAKRYYMNRLKYIIARYSHSPNIMSFELWNELDSPVDWTREMSAYMKSTNPHGQFISTSVGYPWGNIFSREQDRIWSIDTIDMIDRHVYLNFSSIESLISQNRLLSQKYSKYLVVGEFGIDERKNDSAMDSTGYGTALHASLWASIFTRSFAGSLNWWWFEYIFNKNLYHHYTALRYFVNDVDWNSGKTDFLSTGPLLYEEPAASLYHDISAKTDAVWGETNFKEFFVENNGDIGGGPINSYLHGKAKPDYRIEPVFHVDYQADGKFILKIDTVSQGARLVIYLDGNEVFAKDLPAGPGTGPWKKSLYRKDYNVYQCIYDISIEVAIPRGQHTIKVSNAGLDWITIKQIVFNNYTSNKFANGRVLGLRIGKDMIVWIQNRESTWKNEMNGIKPQTIKGASFTINGVEEGSYSIEWWDTFKGKIISRDSAASRGGELKVRLPDLTTDIACKVRKQ